MASDLFHPFRLVGGTALCLQLGHRMSGAIDLYTDSVYGSLDFIVLTRYLRKIYGYVDEHGPTGTGASYFIGDSAEESVKLDLFYTNPFLQPAVEIEGLRLATIADIIAMKMDRIQKGARKKDFWDIAELLNKYPVAEMLALHKKRYPYDHDESLLISNFTNFTAADNDFEPDCLRAKHWQLIKLDIMDAVDNTII
jgi:hypothetical protein